MSVTVIGFGMSRQDLTDHHLTLIRGADILMGGKRHLAAFSDVTAETHVIEGKMSAVAAFIQKRMAECRVVVLASGDPLFYGIGAYLVRKLGPENVEILPNVNTVSAAFAKIKTGWHDAAVVSLHGRNNFSDLADALKRFDKVAVLTDATHTPAKIGEFMTVNRFQAFNICVLEQLSEPDERISWHSPAQIAAHTFAEPNIVLIHRMTADTIRPLYPGMPDDTFSHENGLITKSEVRAVTLSKLRLDRPDLVFWDLGAGSGSVSVEASIFIRTGRIIAVEQHESRIEQIRQNRERFRAANMEIVHGTLPEAIENLPAPDRIFIGGGGKQLETIIERAAKRLSLNGGVMVVNTVLVQNMGIAMETMASCGLRPEITQIQVNNGRSMPWGERLHAQNPVWIIAGSSDFEVNR